MADRLVTAREMQAIDQAAIHDYGIPSIVLMENAGRGAAEKIANFEKASLKVCVVCGKGNNGGDGFVIARHLYNRGYAVTILLMDDPLSLKGDASINFEIVRKIKIPLANDSAVLLTCDFIVDALFGIGLSRHLSETDQQIVKAINQSGKKVYAIDTPSGLNADTGEPMPVAVKAAMTLTMALPKKGLLQGSGPAHSGKIEVIDLGIPKQLLR